MKDVWTPDEDKRISALQAEGKSYSQIAAIMGKSSQSIASRVNRLKHRRNGTTPQRVTRNGRTRRARAVDDDLQNARMAIWRKQRDGARQALAQMEGTP